jgi:hypothetical protein
MNSKTKPFKNLNLMVQKKLTVLQIKRAAMLYTRTVSVM